MRANQIRRGMIILHNGEPHRVLDARHHTPGNLRAMMQTKLRSVITGASLEHRFSATEDVARATLEQHTFKYLYSDGSTHHFMNEETYEQMPLPRASVEDALPFLQPSSSVQVLLVNERPSGVDLPASVVLEVTETEPGVKGDTVSNVTKPATLETGAVVQVPLFVNVGDKIKVDPREKRYIARAN